MSAATGWVRIFDTTGGLPPRSVDTGHGPGVIAVGLGAVWVANAASSTVARLDRHTFERTNLLRLRGTPAAIAIGADAVWVVCTNGWLWRVWPAGPQAEGVARLGRGVRGMATCGGWIWVLRERGDLARVDPVTGEPNQEVALGRGGRRLATDGETLWAIGGRGRKLLRLDGDLGTVLYETSDPGRVIGIAPNGHGARVGCRPRLLGRNGWTYAIDASGNPTGDRHELPGLPYALANAGRTTWMATASRGKREGAIWRIDGEDKSPQLFESTDWPTYDLAVVGSSLLACQGLVLGVPWDGGGVFGGGDMFGGAIGHGGGHGGGGHGGGGGH